ncbi:MAG: ammonium transporter, partial [Verrucomicrobiota bacterium]
MKISVLPTKLFFTAMIGLGILAQPLISQTETEPISSSELTNLQSEVRQLQRDTIEMQRALMNSGITPEVRQEIEKLKKFDSIESGLKKLQEQQLSDAGKLEVLEERAESVAELEVAGEQAAQGFVGANLVWVLIAAFLVMLMQAGFGLLEAGFTRSKNAAHVFSMNLLDYAVGMLAFWAFGFAIMFGFSGGNEALGYSAGLDQGWAISIGETSYSIMGTTGWLLNGDSLYTGGIFTLFLFQAVFATTANTIPTGTLAERWKLKGFIVHSVLVAGFIYPLFGHWVWGGGWLGELGYTDFAGSTVVHMAGGVLALVGAYMVGPRKGKFNADGSVNPIPGHNIPMAFLGTFLLAFGWFGFNAGSTLAGTDTFIGIIAANTALASGAGAAAAALTSKWKFGKPDPSFCCNGLLAGLVGITAPCAFVDAWAAVVIGIICGIAVVFSALIIEEVLRLDDPVGAISVHGTCGAIGGLAVGLFSNGKNGVKGLFYGDGEQFFIQIVGVIACFITFGV